MSNTARIAVQFKDLLGLELACRELGAQISHRETVTFYDNTTVTGTAIRLPGWEYPIVVTDQQLFYDSYEGHWGDMATLKRLRQLYTLHTSVRTEHRLARKLLQRQERNGRIRLTFA